jgi:hypothetical protein
VKTNNAKPVFIVQVTFLLVFILQLKPLFVPAQDIPQPTRWACASCGASAPVGSAVQHKSSCEYSSGTSNSGTGNSGPNWAQILANKKAAAEARKRTESYQLNEKGVKAFNEKKWEEAVRYFKAAVKKNGSDPVIRQNLVNAQNNLNAQKRATEAAKEAYLAQQEELRKKLEEKQRFEQEKNQFQQVLTTPVTVVSPAAVVPEAGPRIGGLTLPEWNEARLYQQRIDSITKKWPLSAREAEQLEQWERQRNRLWQKAISVPGLTLEDRQRLKLRLYIPAVYNNGLTQVKPAPAQLQQWVQKNNETRPAENYERLHQLPSNPAVVHMITDYSAETIEQQLEEKVTDYLEEQKKNSGKHLGYLMNTARIAIAYKEDGTAGAVSEGVETFIIGKIPIPQAQLAVTGGRMYANVAYRTMNLFMTNAMNSINAPFDADQFWNQLKAESGTGRKAVMNFIQWPPDEKEN